MTRLMLLVLFLTATTASAAPQQGPSLELQGLRAMVPRLAEDDIGLLARFHFATHSADFDRTRAFYRSLGWTEGRADFPLTNTHEMARALGMDDLCQYELADGEVISLPGSVNTANIDLLQFRTPFNGDPPYELPNHLGFSYAALATRNLDHDVETLRRLGAELLSEPYGVPGDRFVFFRDPDGVLYRLEERLPPHGDPQADSHLIAMPYIAVGVSDLDTSLEFYASLGYEHTPVQSRTSTHEEARAFGLEEPFRVRTADLALGRGDRHVLRLVQWIEPFDPEPPYPAPINHIGIQRIALLVPDVERAVRILEDRGVDFLSEIAPCCSGTAADAMGIVHLRDPDGAFLELVGPMEPRAPEPPPEGCPAPEIVRRDGGAATR